MQLISALESDGECLLSIGSDIIIHACPCGIIKAAYPENNKKQDL